MKTADICLVLEGTYPFVSGGVSSWVHRLTSDLPDHTFRILHISPKRGFYPKGPVYEMPKNILGVQEVALHDYERMVASEFNYYRAATIYGGSNEIQKNIIAKNVLGLPQG